MVELFGGPQEAPLSIFPECSRLCCSALLGSLCEHALVLFLKQRPIWEESLTRALSLRISNAVATGEGDGGRAAPGLAGDAELTLTLNSA